MTITYEGSGSTTVEALLDELGKQLNPDQGEKAGTNVAATREAWHELGIQATRFLKYCPFDCHYDLHAESQRPA